MVGLWVLCGVGIVAGLGIPMATLIGERRLARMPFRRVWSGSGRAGRR
jgi:hypothetical protein